MSLMIIIGLRFLGLAVSGIFSLAISRLQLLGRHLAVNVVVSVLPYALHLKADLAREVALTRLVVEGPARVLGHGLQQPAQGLLLPALRRLLEAVGLFLGLLGRDEFLCFLLLALALVVLDGLEQVLLQAVILLNLVDHCHLARLLPLLPLRALLLRQLLLRLHLKLLLLFLQFLALQLLVLATKAHALKRALLVSFAEALDEEGLKTGVKQVSLIAEEFVQGDQAQGVHEGQHAKFAFLALLHLAEAHVEHV